jgi:hypothetical protein
MRPGYREQEEDRAVALQQNPFSLERFRRTMSQATNLREQILASLDLRFAAAGFKRPKRDFVWKRTVSRDVRLYLHLNFGVYQADVSVHPNMGARHASVERVLVECGARQPSADAGTFGKMLSELSGGRYNSHASLGPERVADLIWADWCAVGRPFAEDVADLTHAIERLASDDPREWCCISRDVRAVLLPSALAAQGRRADALAWLDRFEAEYAKGAPLGTVFQPFAAKLRERLG